jgi:glycosyltransferase involved in cell wall biosynthesis
MPKVSVIVPLYQNGRYVEQAIRSVLDQTYQDFEIIVVDDGSRDDGPARVQAFGDPRISLISQPNGGISRARNTGFKAARGDYVALLDSDDWWRSDKLARHVAHLDHNPEIGLSLSASRMVDADGGDLGLVQQPSPGPYTLRHMFCRNPVGNGSAPVIRRSVLERVRFHDSGRGTDCYFDEDLRRTEDAEFFLRLAVVGGCRFEALHEPLTVYRINPLGLSANIEAHLGAWLSFRSKVKGYAPALEAEVGDEAEAYFRRYLARRAVRLKDRGLARQLLSEALRLSPRMLIDEPLKTAVTIGAVASLYVLPVRAHAWLEDAVLSALAGSARPPAQPTADAAR